MNILIGLHIITLNQKLAKANSILFKLCHFVSVATIKSIYYAIFHSHISYVCTASWSESGLKTSQKLAKENTLWE